MNNPQNSISIDFGRPWGIRRPYVYRYLEKQWVDKFFTDGILRISSFKQFAKHSDEQRFDNREGTAMIENTANDTTVSAYSIVGSSAFILCGSTRRSDDLAKSFETDSGFRINDTTGFASVIAMDLPGFRGGMEGPAIYATQRIISRGIEGIDLDSLKVDPSSSNDIDSNKLFSAVNAADADDSYFLKHASYESQSEYRLVWYSTNKNAEYIDLECPEALKFCTRFEDLRKWS